MNRGVFYNSLPGCPDISFMGGVVSENADARQKMQQARFEPTLPRDEM